MIIELNSDETEQLMETLFGAALEALRKLESCDPADRHLYRYRNKFAAELLRKLCNCKAKAVAIEVPDAEN